MPKKPTNKLTPRELDVLQGFIQGQRPKEIALTLGLSQFTVQTHVRSIYHKLRANSMAHAIAIYLGTGPAPSEE